MLRKVGSGRRQTRDTKKRLYNLIWWNEGENIKEIQSELEELRAYKAKR